MSYTSGGGDNLDARERLSAMERGDSFAPAKVELNCSDSVFIPPGNNYVFPITYINNLKGRIFEYNTAAQAIRIKQGGVFGYMVSITGVATGPSNFVILMYQVAPPYQTWLIGRMPFNVQGDYLSYSFGGVKLVDVPEGGADYQVNFYNVGGPGGFTVYIIRIELVYLGTR